ncbi:MAG TPA: hypothetical protein VJR89_36810, partial [Polyangiales bacterium]|nr:hypothetical protein [Polyangiales bacterium]
MGSRSNIGLRNISALLLAGLVICATACKVYRKDLLGQTAAGTAGASGSGQAGASGGSAGSEPEVIPEAGAPALDLPMCAGGDCWWSRAEGESCRSAGLPRPEDRPSIPDTSRVAEIYLGLTQIRLGATRSDGMRAEDAWESLGFDLDGLCTNSGSCEGMGTTACKSPGPATPYDGQLCRDNTFGRLQPVIANLRALGDDYGLSEDAFNCELWRGGYNMLVRISGYNGTPDDPLVRVDYYLSPGLEESVPWKCPVDDFRAKYPRWRSARTWAVDESGLTGPITKPGALPDSKFADVEAYVKNNYLVARVPDGSSQGFLGTGEPYRGFLFKARGGLFVGRLSQIKDGTWELSDGMLGGRIAKTDLVSAFRETGFCEAGEVNSFYQSVLEFIDETADMLASGEVDATKPCDAMSYGVAFAASQLLPGQAVKVPPRVQCCAPGKTLDECMAQCGDGKLSGKEKCDTAIPDGMPGACPKLCPVTSDCAPQQLSGSDCATECKPVAVTMVGAKDGCCPKGANVTSDSDCKAQCGNNVVESGETCDPPMSCKTCAPINSCYKVNTTGSAAECNLRCEQTPIKECVAGDGCCPSTCTNANDSDCPATCKNGRLDPGEACENGTERPCPTSCDDRQACTIDASNGN